MNHLADAPFAALSASLHAGPAQAAGPLIIVPLLLARDSDAAPSLRPPGTATTLTRALARGEAEVVELDGGGSVPTLQVRNRGSLPLLLLDGEELLGAKQNRILNTSVLVPAHANLEVPVSCIERGRWRSVGREFTSSSRSLPAHMRRNKTMRVTASLRRGRSYDADQSTVWTEVDAYSTQRGVRSQTSALSDVFDADRAALAAARERITLLPGQVGIAAWLHGRLLGVEVLFSPEVFTEAFDRLLHSYLSEALVAESSSAGSSEPGQEAVTELLRAVGGGSASRHPSPGTGSDVRLESAAGTAAALVDDEDRLVHVVVYGAAA